MKKLRNILLSVAMLLVVVLSTACSSKEATATRTFVMEKNGSKITMVYTYIESEDKVVKQTTTNEIMYNQLPNAKTKEDAQKILDPISQKFQGIKGLKESIEYQDDKFIESLEVDYTDFDYEKAKSLPGMKFSGDPTKTKVSMERSAESLTQNGFEEQK